MHPHALASNELTVVVPVACSSGASPKHMMPLVDLLRRQSARWLDDIGELLVIDSGIGFDSWDPKVKVTHRPFDSHWANLWEGMSQVRTKYMLTIDSDTIIYRPSLFQELVVEFLDGVDIVAAQRTRFCPYFFACRTQLWRDAGRPSLDPTPEHDSMGRATVALLARNPVVKRVYDPSVSRIFFDGFSVETSILDAEQEGVPRSADEGWYHIRNAGLPIVYCSEFHTHRQEALRKLAVTPRWEMLRLLAWKELLYPHLDDDQDGMRHALSVLGVSEAGWDDYLGCFLETHPWINSLWPRST